MPFFVVEPHGQTYGPQLQKLEADPGVCLIRCKNFQEAIPLIRQIKGGIVMTYLGDQKTLVNMFSILKLLRPLTKRKKLRVVVSTIFTQGSIQTKLTKFGVEDMIDEPVNERALGFKITRHVKAMAPQFKKAEDPAQKKGGFGAQQNNGGPQDARKKGEVRYVDTLKLLSDCWLVKDGNFQKVMGKWISNLRGPASTMGRFNQIENANSGEDQFWQWVSNTPDKDPFVKASEGTWVFRGNRPEFRENLWTFVGKHPLLEFQFREDGKARATKLAVDQATGDLLLAKDSQRSLQLLPEILKSIDNVKKFEKEKARESKELEYSEKGEKQPGKGKDARFEKDEVQARDIQDKRSDEEEKKREWGENLSGEEKQREWGENLKKEDEKQREINDKIGEDEASPDWNQKDSEATDEQHPMRDRTGKDPEGVTPEQKKAAQTEAKGVELKTAQETRDAVPKEAQSEEAAALEKIENESLVGLDGEDVPIFVMSRYDFGDENGEWEFVKKLADGEKIYIYVPQKLLSEEIGHPSELEAFWIQQSLKDPFVDAEKEEWTFYYVPPEVRSDFEELDSDVRDFLAGRCTGEKARQPVEVQAKRDAVAAKDLEQKKEAVDSVEGELEAQAQQRSNADPEESIPTIRKNKFELGYEKGQWEFVKTLSSDEKVFVFIPSEMDGGELDDVTSLSVFWFQQSKKDPHESADQMDWVFYYREPECSSDFDDLDSDVQEYLKARLEKGPATEEARERADEKLKGIDGEEVPIYQIPTRDLGTENGEWEFVKRNSRGEAVLVFISQELNSKKVRLEDLPGYWVTETLKEPEPNEERSEWTYYYVRPQKKERFGDLDSDVRDYLDRREKGEFRKPGEPKPEEELVFKPVVVNDEKIYRIPRSDLDCTEGLFEFVHAPVKTERLFVLLTQFMLSGGCHDIRQDVKRFWMFTGSKEPQLSSTKTEWVFYENAPQFARAFDDLSETLQRFLIGRIPGMGEDGLTDEGRRRREQGDLDASLENQNRPPDERIDLEQTEDARALQERIQLDSEDGKPLDPQASDAIDQAMQAAARIELETKNTPPEPIPDPAQATQQVEAERVPGPSLSPLAISFLMSELMVKQKVGREYVARRFCQYVSSSCGGLQVEVWYHHAGKWKPAGTASGPAVKLEDVQEFTSSPEQITEPRLVGESSMISYIGDRQGVLVIFGDGAEKIELNYHAAVAGTAKGLVQTLAVEGMEEAVAAA